MTADPIRRATRITMALYWLQPMTIGGWLALIPHIKDDLGLSKSELAISLLGAPFALLLALQVAGPLVARFGPRHVMMVGFGLQSLMAMLPLLATSQLGLFLALMAFGAAIAVMEVGLNVYAGRVERRSGRTIMSRCHGFWSLGLMAGSFFVAQAGMSLMLAQGAVALASALVGIAVALAATRFPGEVEGRAPPARGSDSTASRNARATALKAASAMWWLFTPWIMSTCSVMPPCVENAWKNSRTNSVSKVPIFGVGRSTFQTRNGRADKSSAA